jgi:hypothetical protein
LAALGQGSVSSFGLLLLRFCAEQRWLNLLRVLWFRRVSSPRRYAAARLYKPLTCDAIGRNPLPLGQLAIGGGRVASVQRQNVQSLAFIDLSGRQAGLGHTELVFGSVAANCGLAPPDQVAPLDQRAVPALGSTQTPSPERGPDSGRGGHRQLLRGRQQQPTSTRKLAGTSKAQRRREGKRRRAQ